MTRFIQKYGKKKLICFSMIVIVATLAIVYGIWYKMEQDYKQSILDKISITWSEDSTVECGAKNVDYKSFVAESYGEVTVPKTNLDTSKVGKIKVIYIASLQGYSKEFPLEITIVDTTTPKIQLAKDKITLNVGSKYDPKDNVKVTDLADGEIKNFKISGDVDFDTVGNYTLTVIASDKAGNQSTKDFIISIEDEESNPTVSHQPANNNSSATKNPQSNNSQSQQHQPNPSPQPQPEPETPPACDDTKWKQIGNSGYVSRSWDEANTWGMNNTPEGYLYGVFPVHDECGGQGWTVDFEKQN